MNRILVVEDDRLFGQTLADLLLEEGFEPTLVPSGEDALDRLYEERFALAILDIELPGASGLEVAKEARSGGDATPLLFLTSHREKEVLLDAFERGGDDYLTKPVDFDELIVRIRALMRRSGNGDEKIGLGEGFSFDPMRRVLYSGDSELALPAKTAELLELLARNLGKVVTREMIEECLYPGRPYSEGSVRVYVNQINQALGTGSVSNIRGIGYRLEKR